MGKHQCCRERKSSPKIAIVIGRFNEAITELLLERTLEGLAKRGVSEESVGVIWVPGVVEIPSVAQEIAANRQVDVVIALGAVVRGETSHYDYVCKQVSDGCQWVSLNYRLPVIFGILTTENEEQAFARVNGPEMNKGDEFAEAALEMRDIFSELRAGQGCCSHH